MAKNNILVTIPDEVVMNKIYLIRDQKVMLYRDLAELYELETKGLKEAVRRNIVRFPEDFMFELTKDEFTNWRTHFATSNSDKMGLRVPPFAFTEHGVLMLANLLNSEKAIQVNIQVVRIFTRIREVLTENPSVKIEIEEIRKRLQNQDKNIELVFNYPDELIEKQEDPPPRKPVGYKRKSEQ